MDPISVSAWGFAFDNLNRNSRFFPKPKDVLEQIEAFKIGATVRFEACGLDGCCDGWKTVTPPDADRKVVRCQCWATFRESGQSVKYSHFGHGYNSQDISFLWKLYRNKADGLHRALNDVEIDGLLAELDKQRNHSPVWRASVKS